MLGLGSRAVAQPQVTVAPSVVAPVTVASTIKQTLTAALATVQAAITAVGTLASASLAKLAPAQNAAQAAVPAFVAAVAQYDALIPTTTFAGMVVGSPVPQLVAALAATTEAVQQEAIAFNAGAYLGRLSRNLQNATG